MALQRVVEVILYLRYAGIPPNTERCDLMWVMLIVVLVAITPVAARVLSSFPQYLHCDKRLHRL